MDIYEKIKNSNYTNKDPYPQRLEKPRIEKATTATSADYKRYAEKLEEYEKALPAFRTAVEQWNKKQNELNELFVKELKEDVFTNSDLKRYSNTIKAIYSEAYERGHSGGHSEIANVFHNLSHILEAVKKDNENW